MASQRFDILAKMLDGATKDDVPEMLQALLVDRFKLTYHRENKEQAVYALVIGKNGPKLKDSPPDEPEPAADAKDPKGTTTINTGKARFGSPRTATAKARPLWSERRKQARRKCRWVRTGRCTWKRPR